MPASSIRATTLAVVLLQASLLFEQSPTVMAGEPQDRLIIALLGDNAATYRPNKLLSIIDWRYRWLYRRNYTRNFSSNLASGNEMAINSMNILNNSTFHARIVRFFGFEMSIKCTDIAGGRPLELHCPGLHYIIKYIAIRLLFLTLGSLAAAIGTCNLAFARKFQQQRGTVLRQIPLSRRNTVMQGFDLLRYRSRAFDTNYESAFGYNGHGMANLQLFDVKDSGRREELLKMRRDE